MGAKEQPVVEPEEPSRAAGACVLVVLVGLVVAVLFAVSVAVAVLVLWTVGGFALWRAVRRVSVSSAPPPPEERHPSCSGCAGQQPVSATPSGTQKGMWIYSYALPDRPNHTHIHLTGEEVNET